MYDESESEPPTQPDTPNSTKFHPDDANHDTKSRLDGTATFEQHYSRLAKHNTGVYNGKWADETMRRNQDKLATFDAIASYLELTDYQKEEGRREFDALNLQKLSAPNVDTPLIAVMVAAIVVKKDGRYYHPNASDETNDDLFRELLDDLVDFDSVLHSIYGKVRHRLEDR